MRFILYVVPVAHCLVLSSSPHSFHALCKVSRSEASDLKCFEKSVCSKCKNFGSGLNSRSASGMYSVLEAKDASLPHCYCDVEYQIWESHFHPSTTVSVLAVVAAVVDYWSQNSEE